LIISSAAKNSIYQSVGGSGGGAYNGCCGKIVAEIAAMMMAIAIAMVIAMVAVVVMAVIAITTPSTTSASVSRQDSGANHYQHDDKEHKLFHPFLLSEKIVFDIPNSFAGEIYNYHLIYLARKSKDHFLS